VTMFDTLGLTTPAVQEFLRVNPQHPEAFAYICQWLISIGRPVPGEYVPMAMRIVQVVNARAAQRTGAAGAASGSGLGQAGPAAGPLTRPAPMVDNKRKTEETEYTVDTNGADEDRAAQLKKARTGSARAAQRLEVHNYSHGVPQQHPMGMPGIPMGPPMGPPTGPMGPPMGAPMAPTTAPLPAPVPRPAHGMPPPVLRQAPTPVAAPSQAPTPTPFHSPVHGHIPAPGPTSGTRSADVLMQRARELLHNADAVTGPTAAGPSRTGSMVPQVPVSNVNGNGYGDGHDNNGNGNSKGKRKAQHEVPAAAGDEHHGKRVRTDGAHVAAQPGIPVGVLASTASSRQAETLVSMPASRQPSVLSTMPPPSVIPSRQPSVQPGMGPSMPSSMLPSRQPSVQPSLAAGSMLPPMPAPMGAPVPTPSAPPAAPGAVVPLSFEELTTYLSSIGTAGAARERDAGFMARVIAAADFLRASSTMANTNGNGNGNGNAIAIANANAPHPTSFAAGTPPPGRTYPPARNYDVSWSLD
jgi:hypothetical protein